MAEIYQNLTHGLGILWVFSIVSLTGAVPCDDVIQVTLPSSYSARTGQNVTLQCTFTPPAHVHQVRWQWSSQEYELDNLFGIRTHVLQPAWNERLSFQSPASLVISGVTAADAGAYTCGVKITLVNPVICDVANSRYFTKLTILSVLVPVGGISITRSRATGHDVTKGDTAYLSCITASGTTPITYTWLLNNTPLQQTGRELAISNIQPNQAGPYRCNASNPVSWQQSNTFTFHVLYLPTSVSLSLVGKSTSDPIQAGTQVVFQCTTPDGNPAPILQIYRESTAVSNTGSSPLRYTRTILDTDNLATFTCKATTTGFSGEITSNVLNLTEIHYKPTVTVTIEGNPVTVAEGDDVTLQCDAHGNPPVYTEYQWTHITFSSPESQVVSTGRELVLSRVTYLENGEYVCSVSNSVGQGLGKKRLDVLYSPKITVESRIIAASIGEPATLSITVTTNPANVSFTWQKSDGNSRESVVGGIVLTDPSSLKSKLFISSVQGSDYGQYLCTVSHTMANQEFTFEIKPKGPPERPTDFRILSWTSVSVTLTWVSGFNGGSNQSFYIQYKETSRTRWQRNDQLVFLDPGYMKTSKANVPDLSPSTSYDFRLVSINNHPSTNSSGFTGAFTQKTKARPKVIDDKLSVSITPTVATVSWTIWSGIEDITSYVVKYCERGTVVCNRHTVTNRTATSAVITLDEGFQDYTFSLQIYEEDDLVKVIDQPTSDPCPVQHKVGVIVAVVVAVLVLLILSVITAIVVRHFRKSKTGRDVPGRETSATGGITEMKDLNSQTQVRPPAMESSIYDVPDHQVNQAPIYTDLQPHSNM